VAANGARLGRVAVSGLIAARRDEHFAADARLTRLPARLAQRVSLLRDGPETYAAMLRAFDRAANRINVLSYALQTGEVGERVADGLIRAAARGVEVRVLYDRIGGIDCATGTFEALRKHGIAALAVCPPGTTLRKLLRGAAVTNRRNRRKIATVDGRVGFIGGVNITQSYWRNSRVLRRRRRRHETPADDLWRDTHLELHGPAVADLDGVFAADWTHVGGRDGAWCPRAPTPGPVQGAGGTIVRIVTTSHRRSRFNEPFALYAEALRRARETICLTQSCFAPPMWLLREVCDAARRGVDVQLIVPERSDNRIALYASRSNYARLLDAGVHLYEMTGSFLHTRTMVVDGWWSIVGSANLDMRSWLHNDETCAVVYDDGFGERMEALFENDLAACRVLSKRRWQRRGFGEHIKEHATRPLYRWL